MKSYGLRNSHYIRKLVAGERHLAGLPGNVKPDANHQFSIVAVDDHVVPARVQTHDVAWPKGHRQISHAAILKRMRPEGRLGFYVQHAVQ
jgi:hypothetical protein